MLPSAPKLEVNQPGGIPPILRQQQHFASVNLHLWLALSTLRETHPWNRSSGRPPSGAEIFRIQNDFCPSGFTAYKCSADRPSSLASFVVNVPRIAPLARPAATLVSTLVRLHAGVPADRVKIKLLTYLMTRRRRFQISALDHPPQSWHLTRRRSLSHSNPPTCACVC